VPLTLREFSIFDRWGHRVFTTRNIAQGWDGRINGQLSPPGVYVYMIDGVGEKGDLVLKGTVLLIR
jgi:gliding motility-associated-like protein